MPKGKLTLPSQKVLRPTALRLGNVQLELPVFFPSVSSIKTNLSPLDYIRILNALHSLSDQFLVSAFDLPRANTGETESFIRELSKSRALGSVILMDSGNYESYWKDSSSAWQPSDFHGVLRTYPYDLALGFDEQKPPTDFENHLALLLQRNEHDQVSAGPAVVIPIIHSSNPDDLPTLCAEFASRSQVDMLALPERRLGSGLFNRLRALVYIGEALDNTGRYVGLHLLGTGNPISIALYALAGADSFDGLEWCQTVVDHESALLFHFSHADFFASQTGWADEDLPFELRVLAHNLEFYRKWIEELRFGIRNGTAVDFFRLRFPDRVFVRCSSALGWGA